MPLAHQGLRCRIGFALLLLAAVLTLACGFGRYLFLCDDAKSHMDEAKHGR